MFRHPSPGDRRIVRLVAAAVLAGSLGLVGACGSDTSSDPSGFVTQADFKPGVTPPCLLHQNAQPPAAVQGGAGSRPQDELTFLAYYTAAGDKSFCDGARPNDTDKAWAQLYARLTSNPEKVHALLS